MKFVFLTRQSKGIGKNGRPSKETRRMKVNLGYKKRNNSYSAKLTLPLLWLNDMGLNLENKEIDVSYDPRMRRIIIDRIKKDDKKILSEELKEGK
ncbi:MAG: hypothetical protein ACRC5S_03400 [Cetobacterium sp.]